MAYVEYPKALYLDGWHNLASYRRVMNAEEEASARAEGYKTLPEWPHPDLPPVTDERLNRWDGAAPAKTPDGPVLRTSTPAELEAAPPKTDRFAAARAAKQAKRAG